MNTRTIREAAPSFTQEQADTFTPCISPESLPFILSSVVSVDPTIDSTPRTIRKYYISRTTRTVGSNTADDGALQIYQGAYIYPYWGSNTMYAHVEVVFEEVPIPHESVLKWCSLALKAGPVSSFARANQLVVVNGNHLHYLWRVLSLEGETAISDTARSLDITNLHLWRWVPNTKSGDALSTPQGTCSNGGDTLLDIIGVGKWVCGRTSIDVETGGIHTLTTSRGTGTIDWDGLSSIVSDEEPIHKLYMTLLGLNLL